jgi:hypothetical protein
VGVDNLNSPVTLGVYKDNDGTYNEWFGGKVYPSVKLALNPKPELAKTFDNLRLYSNGPLYNADLTVRHVSDVDDQFSLGMNIDVTPRESYYRLKYLRDEFGRRMRGSKGELVLRWNKDTDSEVTLHSVITKYKTSSRVI